LNETGIKIVDMNDKIKKKLEESGISEEMGSLENCDFLAIVENDEKIVGASGIGGIFKVLSLQIHPNYFNKGLGPKLIAMVIEEAKNRKYSYISASRNPENINAVRLHDFFKLRRVFQIQYRPKFTRDVIILEFSNKGEMMGKFLSCFNNIVGMSILVICLKIFRKILFKFVLTYPPEEFPEPKIIYSIKKFKKI
jgi:GNAT superfamily N-acetyltransferase|tara:strand:- start:43 stop:627 length:585 start_codon:yes stop_codon:yes gene_type:complete